MYTPEEILALDKMVVKNNRCSHIEISYGFRGMGNTNTYSGSGLSSYESFSLKSLDGKKPLHIDYIDFGSGASIYIDLIVKAVVDDIMYCVKNGKVIVGKVFTYSNGIAHDTTGTVKVELR